MIACDPRNWIRILIDFPGSPVFRMRALDVAAAGACVALAVWIEGDATGLLRR